MNNKIFLKIGWLFIIGLLSYLFFVVFFLSPKINNYLSETEINNSKTQFSKIVSIINSKSRTIEDKDKLINEVQLLLSSTTLGQTGYIYIFDGDGKIVFDPSGEFDSKDFSTIPLPSANNNLLFEELKNAYNKIVTKPSLFLIRSITKMQTIAISMNLEKLSYLSIVI